jgi:hypothetical protein
MSTSYWMLRVSDEISYTEQLSTYIRMLMLQLRHKMPQAYRRRLEAS